MAGETSQKRRKRIVLEAFRRGIGLAAGCTLFGHSCGPLEFALEGNPETWVVTWRVILGSGGYADFFARFTTGCLDLPDDEFVTENVRGELIAETRRHSEELGVTCC